MGEDPRAHHQLGVARLQPVLHPIESDAARVGQDVLDEHDHALGIGDVLARLLGEKEVEDRRDVQAVDGLSNEREVSNRSRLQEVVRGEQAWQHREPPQPTGWKA